MEVVPGLTALIVGLATVLLLNPDVGDHEYVTPLTGAAPKLAVAPEQN
jgi:hypothetical protein